MPLRPGRECIHHIISMSLSLVLNTISARPLQNVRTYQLNSNDHSCGIKVPTKRHIAPCTTCSCQTWQSCRFAKRGSEIGASFRPPRGHFLKHFLYVGPKNGYQKRVHKWAPVSDHSFTLQHSHKPHARHARVRALAQEVTPNRPRPDKCSVNDVSWGPRSGPRLFGGHGRGYATDGAVACANVAKIDIPNHAGYVGRCRNLNKSTEECRPRQLAGRKPRTCMSR